MTFTDLFSSITDFRSYAEGLQADTTYAQLMPSIRSAGAEIIKIITAGAYIAISAGTAYIIKNESGEATGDTIPETDIQEAKELLKTAVATRALYAYQIFNTVKKNGSDASLRSEVSQRLLTVIEYRKLPKKSLFPHPSAGIRKTP